MKDNTLLFVLVLGLAIAGTVLAAIGRVWFGVCLGVGLGLVALIALL